MKSLPLEVENNAIKEHLPSDLQFFKIGDYCSLLLPFKDLTTQLGGSNYINASLLYPAINYLVNHELPNQTFETFEMLTLNGELIKSISSIFCYLYKV